MAQREREKRPFAGFVQESPVLRRFGGSLAPSDHRFWRELADLVAKKASAAPASGPSPGAARRDE
jgi:hypothetical protein